MTQRVTYRGRRVQRGHELERLRTHWEGVSDLAIARARDGVNERCVDCGEVPFVGGLRCPDCFLEIARPLNRGHGTAAGYAAHRRRGETPCGECRLAHNAYNKYRSAA